MEELLVIKIGGNIIDDAKALQSFLADFAALPGNKILVHGGGKLATDLSNRLGIETQMVDGRRITGDETIQVVTMAYAGWINKNIVAKLQSMRCNAIGLSGADGGIIPAGKRPLNVLLDYGWVGDVLQEEVNGAFLADLMAKGYVPVIAPITCNRAGDLLNINADTIAQALAQALSKLYHTTLIYCFEKNGVLLHPDKEESVIKEMSYKYAMELKDKGTISKGMVPKIDNAFNALRTGVQKVVIGHASVIKELAGKEMDYGTHFRK